MAVGGNNWGREYAIVTEDGERIVLQGQDVGFNIKTPESAVGWDLAYVQEVAGDPNALMINGRLFRAAPGQ